MALNLEALRSIHKTMQNPHCWNFHGICNAYREACWWGDGLSEEEAYFILKGYFPRWEKFSGNVEYPIPAAAPFNRYDQVGAYMAADAAGLWDRENSPYAELRWELLEWLISEAERENAASNV